MDRCVGVDIGGSGIKGAVVDLTAGAFAAERIRLVTPEPATPQRVAEVVAEVLDQVGVPGPVGVTLPSVIRAGVVETAANIDPGWIGTHAVELFGKRLGRPVSVINDADAAGVAEARFGTGRAHRGTLLLLTLGTGIGSALLVDGTLVPNTELGHLPHHHQDFEDWAADSVRKAEELSWEHWAGRLQTYLEMVQRLFWPDLIVIGGGVSRKADKFLPYISLRTRVVPAALQNDAGIIGAALHAAAEHPA